MIASNVFATSALVVIPATSGAEHRECEAGTQTRVLDATETGHDKRAQSPAPTWKRDLGPGLTLARISALVAGMTAQRRRRVCRVIAGRGDLV